MFELFLIDESGETALHKLGATPIYVGRAANNDVVLPESSVSSRHLAVWAASDRVFVEDLRSRNGSFVNERPLRGVGRLREGETLRIGVRVRLVVRETGEAFEGPAGTPFLVEDADSGVRFPVRSDRVRFGNAADADVPMGSGPDETAMLLLDERGDFYLGLDDDLVEVQLDVPFAVGERRFVLRKTPLHLTVTRDVASTKYPYLLEVTLEGGTGPAATLRNIETHNRHVIEAENRAVLLYLLARQFVEDADKPAEERGWCYDEQLITGIWGKTAASEQTNNLSVLLCRTRGELRKVGFDPWFIERRKRNIRARVAEARLS